MVILEKVDLHKSVISPKFIIKIQVKYKSNIAMLQKYNEQKGGVTKTATVQSQSACTNAIQRELGIEKRHMIKTYKKTMIHHYPMYIHDT